MNETGIARCPARKLGSHRGVAKHAPEFGHLSHVPGGQILIKCIGSIEHFFHVCDGRRDE
jgi:hypothetical protein